MCTCACVCVQDSIVASAPEDITEGSFLDSEYQRTSQYLSHPVFNKYMFYTTPFTYVLYRPLLWMHDQ